MIESSDMWPASQRSFPWLRWYGPGVPHEPAIPDIPVTRLLDDYASYLDTAIARGSVAQDTRRFDAIDSALERYTAAEASEQLALRAESTRLRADYRAGCATLGSEVKVELPGGAALRGIAEDVDRDGRLLILDAAGHRRAVAAGDVVHQRPSG